MTANGDFKKLACFISLTIVSKVFMKIGTYPLMFVGTYYNKYIHKLESVRQNETHKLSGILQYKRIT